MREEHDGCRFRCCSREKDCLHSSFAAIHSWHLSAINQSWAMHKFTWRTACPRNQLKTLTPAQQSLPPLYRQPIRLASCNRLLRYYGSCHTVQWNSTFIIVCSVSNVHRWAVFYSCSPLTPFPSVAGSSSILCVDINRLHTSLTVSLWFTLCCTNIWWPHHTKHIKQACWKPCMQTPIMWEEFTFTIIYRILCGHWDWILLISMQLQYNKYLLTQSKPFVSIHPTWHKQPLLQLLCFFWPPNTCKHVISLPHTQGTRP